MNVGARALGPAEVIVGAARHAASRAVHRAPTVSLVVVPVVTYLVVATAVVLLSLERVLGGGRLAQHVGEVALFVRMSAVIGAMLLVSALGRLRAEYPGVSRHAASGSVALVLLCGLFHVFGSSRAESAHLAVMLEPSADSWQMVGPGLVMLGRWFSHLRT